MRAEALVVLVALGLALGCSDDGHRLGGLSEDVSGSAARRAGLCKSGADLEFIDQMEDGDGTIDMVEQRGGVWFAFNDKSTDSQFPSIDAETFSMSELTPARAGSHRAARSHGGGFTVWGAGIGFELYNQKAYDLSRYAGITFWARRAPGTASALRFAVTDSATAPRGGKCQDFVDYSTCSDYFGVDLSLSTAFRRYSFTWQELSQEGWGEPHPASIETSEVYGVRFQADPIEDFDFWIDDIALLCHPE
jgi:endoglucanase